MKKQNQQLVSVVIPTFNRKEKLARLIKSVLKSTYTNKEIIVVDDASTDGTSDMVRKMFPKVKVVRNKKELLVSASRNIGIKNSNGKFIFLIDSDNVIDKNTIKELVKILNYDSKVGIVGPLIYYYSKPKVIWCAGITRDMFTSRTIVKGRNQIDNGQFKEIMESDDFPNSFMVRSDVLKKSGLFDEKNFPIHYEESDFCQRIKKSGYKIILNPSAKVWHDIELISEKGNLSRYFHLQNETRAYYAGRGRIMFMRKYASSFQYLIFSLIFMPLFTIFYTLPIIFSDIKSKKKVSLIKSYLKGTIDGILK